MSNHLISITDERLARLYNERIAFELSDDDNLIYVQSVSRPRIMHRVVLEGDAIRCSCETTEGQACKHRATGAAHWFPVRCLFRWQQAAQEKFINLRHRIRTGELTKSERRRLGRAVRAVNEELLAEALA